MTATETDPHALLADSTRLTIFRELVQCFIESPLDRGVSFTTLFDRTEIDDSGLFNYHLNQLLDTLATKTKSGYTLTYAGVQVASNILSVRTFSFPDSLHQELSRACPLCANKLGLSYDGGLLTVGCESCHTFEDIAPPRLVQAHPPDRVADILAIGIVANVRRAQRGVCAQCFGHVEWDIHEGAGGPTSKFNGPVVILGVCQTCAAVHVSDPGGFAATSAEVMECHSDSIPGFWEDPAGWFIRTHDTTLRSYDLSEQTATVVVHLDDRHVRVQMDHRGVPSKLASLDRRVTDSN